MNIQDMTKFQSKVALIVVIGTPNSKVNKASLEMTQYSVLVLIIFSLLFKIFMETYEFPRIHL